MSNIRLFYSKSLSLNLTDKLDKSQSHYVSKVMRIQESEVFSLFNNRGEWEAKILNISKSIVEFNVTKQLRQKENIKELWLAFSPIKSNYFNFMIQKATELGVTKITPIVSERTEVKELNFERAKKIDPNDIAAIVVEIQLGEGGYIPASNGFLKKLREITKKHNILLIFDEVQTGFGRTGEMFELYNLTIDFHEIMSVFFDSIIIAARPCLVHHLS